MGMPVDMNILSYCILSHALSQPLWWLQYQKAGRYQNVVVHYCGHPSDSNNVPRCECVLLCTSLRKQGYPKMWVCIIVHIPRKAGISQNVSVLLWTSLRKQGYRKMWVYYCAHPSVSRDIPKCECVLLCTSIKKQGCPKMWQCIIVHIPKKVEMVQDVSVYYYGHP